MTLKLQTDSIPWPQMRWTKLPQNESLRCLEDFHLKFNHLKFNHFHFICSHSRSKWPCIKDGKRCQNGVQFVVLNCWPIFDRLWPVSVSSTWFIPLNDSNHAFFARTTNQNPINILGWTVPAGAGTEPRRPDRSETTKASGEQAIWRWDEWMEIGEWPSGSLVVNNGWLMGD